MKKFFLVCLAVLTVASCGNEKDDPKPPPVEGDFVSGAVLAPNGTVALLENVPAVQRVVDWLIPPAYANLVGILPVSGATVELVRIDNTGAQVGAVIATATTTSAGSFTLVFPAGQTIPKTGDLIVRVSGSGTEMRGQIVGARADVNPYSEYLLQRFIDDGFDLATLDSNDINHVLNFIEGYQLDVGADLDSTLSALDAAVGPLVDKQFEIVNSEPGDSASLAGIYRAVEVRWALMDDDNLNLVVNGEFNYSTWINIWRLTDQESGFLLIAPSAQDFTSSRLATSSAPEDTLYFTSLQSAQSGNTGVFFSDANILYSETNFAQSVNDDIIRKTQPSIPQFHKTLNNNTLVALTAVDSVNYRFLNDDDDVLDPQLRAGDQTSRGVLIATKAPADATAADVTGLFGRVGLSVFVNSDGRIEIETERNILSFDGVGSFASQAGTLNHLERNGLGASSFSTSALTANPGISYAVDDDGSITLAGEEGPRAFVNDGFDFYSSAANASTDDADEEDNIFADADIDKDFAVKLPSAPLTITDKVYRVIYTGMAIDGDSLSINNSLLDTFLTFTSATTGVLDGGLAAATQVSRLDEINVAETALSAAPVAIALANDGSLSITYTDTGGDLQLNGFMNHDGSFAVLNANYTPTGLDTNLLGMAVLVEVTN